jgi:lipopolysaccharide biosynthesis glycosyltransferase
VGNGSFAGEGAHKLLTLSTCSLGRFGKNAKVVHFLGRTKPWNYTYNPQTKSVNCDSQDPTVSHPEFLNLWWDTFTTNVLPLLQHHGLVKDASSYLMMVSSVCFTLTSGNLVLYFLNLI